MNGYGAGTDAWGLTPEARDKWFNAFLGGISLALFVSIVLYLVIR